MDVSDGGGGVAAAARRPGPPVDVSDGGGGVAAARREYLHQNFTSASHVADTAFHLRTGQVGPAIPLAGLDNGHCISEPERCLQYSG